MVNDHHQYWHEEASLEDRLISHGIPKSRLKRNHPPCTFPVLQRTAGRPTFPDAFETASATWGPMVVLGLFPPLDIFVRCFPFTTHLLTLCELRRQRPARYSLVLLVGEAKLMFTVLPCVTLETSQNNVSMFLK